MSGYNSELAELVDLFCEGDIAPEQAARLEALVVESQEARQYLMDCFQIHCELAWRFRRESQDLHDLAKADSAVVVPEVVRVADGTTAADAAKAEPKRNPRRGWMLGAIAAAVLVVVMLGVHDFFPGGTHKTELLPIAGVARIAQMKDVRWDQGVAPAIDVPLTAGSKLAIQEGLVQVVFQSGASVILQGPAVLELQTPAAAALLRGSLAAEVPVEARGFAIHAPNATIVDMGTSFGVACQGEQTDVEVFVGKVVLRLDHEQSGGLQDRPLLANHAVRVSGLPGHDSLKIEELAVGSRHFVQYMSRSTALFQSLAGDNPHLIHFYPFQGATNSERLRDRRGKLDLREVTMRDGDGGGRLEFARSGPDRFIQVVVPSRAELTGGVHGLGLQSKDMFRPPANMTIELLLNRSAVKESQEGFIASAVATRHDHDQCGFLVTAIGDGELSILLDGGAQWLQSGFKFAPDRWYYVASTFSVKHGETIVDAFVADLSETNPKLSWIVQNQSVPGVPASGRLGIGEGFDGKMGNAYPWAGQLGVIAIYDTLLDRQTLENHVSVLPGKVSSRPESAVSR